MNNIKLVTHYSANLSKAEKIFITRFKKVCQENDEITNVFIYGSLVQEKTLSDSLSDMDIFVLLSKTTQFELDFPDMVLISKQNYEQICYLEYILDDGHRIDITILSETGWQEMWALMPEYYASILYRGVKFLVKKNDFLTKFTAPKIVNPYAMTSEIDMIWQEFVSAYLYLVKMYVRKNVGRIYGYGVRLAEELSKLFSFKIKCKLYQKYLETGEIRDILADPQIAFANFNRLQIGRDFDKFATLRQKQIFNIIHKLTECRGEDLLKLYDLTLEEFYELNNYPIKFNEENAILFRKYAILWLTGKDEVSPYLKEKKANKKTLCNLVSDFL